MEKKRSIAAARVIQMDEAPTSMMPESSNQRIALEADVIVEELLRHKDNEDFDTSADFEEYRRRVTEKYLLINQLRNKLLKKQEESQDNEEYDQLELLLNLLVVYDILVNDVAELASDYKDDPLAQQLLLLLNRSF